MCRNMPVNSAAVLIATIVALVALSCKPRVPQHYIQPTEMEDLLYDYYIAQAIASQSTMRDTVAFNKSAYYFAVLAKHGVTEAEFDSSLVYYYTETKRLYEIYRNLSERIGNVAMGLGASVGEIGKYSQLSSEGDTANIWHDATAAILMPMPPYNKVTFSIEADSTFRRGDSFQLNFMTDFVYQSGTKDAVICLVLRYDDGSVNTQVNSVPSTGVSRLRLESRDDTDLSSIDGFIYLGQGSDDSQTLKLMFISQLQLIRFHRQPAQDIIIPAKRDSVPRDGRSDSLSIGSDSVVRRANAEQRVNTDDSSMMPVVPALKVKAQERKQ